MWFKAGATVSPQGTKGALLQMLDPSNPVFCALQIALDASLTPVLTFYDDNTLVDYKAAASVPANVWTQMAVTGQCIDTQKRLWQVSLYVNGQDTSINRRFAPSVPPNVRSDSAALVTCRRPPPSQRRCWDPPARAGSGRHWLSVRVVRAT